MAEEPLTANDRLIANATERFLSKLTSVESSIKDEIMKILRDMTVKEGFIVARDKMNKKLAMYMDQRIEEAINKTSYDSDIEKLIANFDNVEENAVQLQLEYSDLDVDLSKIKSGDIQQWAVDNTIYRLKDAGFKYNVIQPIKESLTRAVMLGGNLSDLEQEVVAKTNGALKNYSGGVVRDLFSQYEGVVQKKIETVYDLNAILYVGGLKKTSRPQCKKWVGMRVILKTDLQNEINWAFRNGNGMIEATTPDTFTIYRGGWGCNHKAIPTRR